jgi:hypothetical protein
MLISRHATAHHPGESSARCAPLLARRLLLAASVTEQASELARMAIVASCLATLVGCAPPAAPRANGSPDAAPGEDASMAEWKILFDGTLTSAWKMSTIVNQPGHDDPGRFDLEGDALIARPGTDIGLLWHTDPTPRDYELVLQWRQSAPDDNSGVFVRFPDLESKGYNNTAFVAAHFGFEVQIDNTGHPDGAPRHTTGAIYDVIDQQFSLVAPRAVGEWNDYRIRITGDVYEVFLNGVQTTRFENTDHGRGAAAPSFVGIQTHTGNVAFRDLRLRPL